MKDSYPFKSGIGLMEPVVLANQNVCLLLSGKQEFRRVTWLEAIPPFQFLDIGALGVQTQSGRTSATRLQMPKTEFAQLRWWTIDPVQVRLFHPQADGNNLLLNIQAPYDDTIINRDPCLHLTELYTYEDQNPWFEALNYSDYGINTCRFIAMGFRFTTDPLDQTTIGKIKANQEPCTYLPASGSGGRPRV